jgi:hypothetical protein|tara:strand:- start:16 stop:117 length:102 start_codon:yes stop_codon:yes gene_type:complete
MARIEDDLRGAVAESELAASKSIDWNGRRANLN